MASSGADEAGVTLRRLYALMTARLPQRVVARLEGGAPIHPFAMLYRWRVRRAVRGGPPYRPTYRSIVIDVTTRCTLRCVDCNRSCGAGQLSDAVDLPLGVIDGFIADSVARGRRWRVIQLEGGEPALHPQIEQIVERLRTYIARHTPTTRLVVVTNGYGETVRRTGERLAALGVDVQSDDKTTPVQPQHCAFNVAPCEMEELRGLDFSEGCYLPVLHGLGLCVNGYFPHPVCGGIDRVFGFALGRTRLPEPGDPLDDQFAELCRLCGCYRMGYRLRANRLATPEDALRGTMSASWRRAYRHGLVAGSDR